MSLIAPQTLSQAALFAAEFASAEPFRHVVIENFFDEALCSGMLHDFPGFEERFALNEMGQVGGKAVRMQVRDLSDNYRRLDDYLQTREFLDFVSTVTGIPDLLYDPDYIGGGTHENRHGQALDAHVDFNYHPGTRWHRRLNLIVYLNPQWEKSWGGNLELHSDPWDALHNRRIDIVPLLNRAVIFETTETSWHGFTPIDLPERQHSLSRKSFAIYLYTKERPAELTAPAHATVYVPEALPDGVVAGATLGEVQAREIHRRFDGALAQLKFLYQREKDFSAQIAALEGAMHELRGSSKIDLQGYATQPEGVVGHWPDGWVARSFVLVFIPTRAMQEIVLEVWVPSQLAADQVLQITLDGVGFSHTVRPGARSTLTLPAKRAADARCELRITASQEWCPATTDATADRRALAFKLIETVIRH